MLFQRAFWLNLASACMVAVVAATPIAMSGVMDRGFEIAKKSVAEPLVLLALGAILLAQGARWLKQHQAAARMAMFALAAFLVVAAISTVMSEMKEVALFGGYFRREGLLAWCVYGAFFFAVLGWAQHAGRVRGFIDVMLLASVVPIAYALQQRLDLDFYVVYAREFDRPGSTLGNPLFLGAYLAILLPITAVRCWQSRAQPSQLALWLLLALLQGGTLAMTQSRGPLLAGMVGLLMLACFAAGYARARRIFYAAAAVFVLAAAGLAAINTVAPLRQWAQEAPVLSRLVFDLDLDLGSATRRASTSAGARLGIWQAGMNTFAAAPLHLQLFGFGPESAYMHYFPHMPPLVMRMVGYAASNTYDRLHADTFDIGLNFGLLGWLAYFVFFGAVIYAAARALFGLSGRGPPWLFCALTVGGGVTAGFAAALFGLASAAVPAFGLGVSAGWLLFLAGCSWRALTHGAAHTAALPSGNWMLLAALTAALLVFWIDAQVNIPVLTTRLFSFGMAALILLISQQMVDDTHDTARAQADDAGALVNWGLALALVAACAGVMPELLAEATANELAAQHWWLRSLPVLSLLALAAWANCTFLRTARSGQVGSKWFLVALGAAALYAVCHLALMVRVGGEFAFDDAARIAVVAFSGPVYIGGLCIVFALLAVRSGSTDPAASLLARGARYAALAVAVLVLSVACLGWRTTEADVVSYVAKWAAARQPDVSEQLVAEAMRLMPYERYYQRQFIFDLLSRAVADIRQLGSAPERYPVVDRNLAMAELQARETLKQFPRDAWSVLALANVLQIRALRLLRPLNPVAGGAAAQEANELFLRAHRLFPSQPLLLRNWAQLLFDQGNAPDAYKLLDLMERLIPNEPEPYTERIIMAQQLSDLSTISSTVARARRALPPALYKQVSDVAELQRN